MATTAAITLTSDIMPSYSSYSKTMTLTKAGALTDIEETTRFSRRKLTSTTATDLIIMADASLIQEHLIVPQLNATLKISVMVRVLLINQLTFLSL